LLLEGLSGLEIVTALALSVEARREPFGERVTARTALADTLNGAVTAGH
jgi:hypothetical protein